MTIQSLVSVPAARIDDLVVTQTAEEVLVYDKLRHEIHHLNRTSAAIWRLCDGQRRIAELVRDAAVDVEIVQIAVTKLAEANLLDGPVTTEFRVSSPSRRAFLRKSAVAGAIAVPAIVSITAPAAATHNSTHTGSCNVGPGGACGVNACCNGGRSCVSGTCQ